METLVMTESDETQILQFEKSRPSFLQLNEIEQSLKSWHAEWREESLRHYLPLGWSFKVQDENSQLKGYFLAQPILFFKGMTQNLWLEHLAADQAADAKHLVDVAYRMAREKHFQTLILNLKADQREVLGELKPEWLNETMAVVKTAKY